MAFFKQARWRNDLLVVLSDHIVTRTLTFVNAYHGNVTILPPVTLRVVFLFIEGVFERDRGHGVNFTFAASSSVILLL